METTAAAPREVDGSREPGVPGGAGGWTPMRIPHRPEENHRLPPPDEREKVTTISALGPTGKETALSAVGLDGTYPEGITEIFTNNSPGGIKTSTVRDFTTEKWANCTIPWENWTNQTQTTDIWGNLTESYENFTGLSFNTTIFSLNDSDRVTLDWMTLNVPHYLHPAFIYIRVIGGGALSLLGLVLNISALVLILHTRRRNRNTQDMLMAYLCVIETLTSAWSLPLFALDQWTMSGLFHPALCKMKSYLNLKLHGDIPLAFLLIAAHRCLLVLVPTSPMANFYGKKGTACCIIGVQLLTLIAMAPPLFDVGSTFTQNNSTGVCTTFYDESTRLYNIMLQVTLTCIPLLLMIVCYVIILRKIRHQNNQICNRHDDLQKASSFKNSKKRTNTDLSTRLQRKQEERRRKRYIRVTALSALAVAAFIIADLPFVVKTIFPRYLDTYMYTAVTSVLVFSHVVTSPLVYVCGDAKLGERLRAGLARGMGRVPWCGREAACGGPSRGISQKRRDRRRKRGRRIRDSSTLQVNHQLQTVSSVSNHGDLYKLEGRPDTVLSQVGGTVVDGGRPDRFGGRAGNTPRSGVSADTGGFELTSGLLVPGSARIRGHDLQQPSASVTEGHTMQTMNTIPKAGWEKMGNISQTKSTAAASSKGTVGLLPNSVVESNV